MAADYDPCPQAPCENCTGDSAVLIGQDESGKPVYQSSWEWCQQMDACAATIDWEKVMGR